MFCGESFGNILKVRKMSSSRTGRSISLEWMPLIFVYLYTRTQSIQKQMVEYDIKSKYSPTSIKRPPSGL